MRAPRFIVDAPTEHRQRGRVAGVEDDEVVLADLLERTSQVVRDGDGQVATLEQVNDVVRRLPVDGEQLDARCHGSRIPPVVPGSAIQARDVAPSLPTSPGAKRGPSFLSDAELVYRTS
ncbi:MAG: hypothetical protein ABIP53_09740 [Candidatus Limnocylindrales bacterium]